jgi:hypothetical protein
LVLESTLIAAGKLLYALKVDSSTKPYPPRITAGKTVRAIE